MDETNSFKRGPVDDTSNPKRSRGLGVVTPNACTECRKKRAKCDGRNPCGRCASQRGTKCIYEVPVRQSKENMRNEIEQLRKHQLQTERILAALAANDRAEAVLEQLRRGERLDNISDSLDKTRQSHSPMDPSVTTYERYSDQEAIMNALNPAQSTIAAPLMTLTLNDAFEMGLNARYSGSNVERPHQVADMQSWHTSATPESNNSRQMSWTSGSGPFDLGLQSEASDFKFPVPETPNEQTRGSAETESAVNQARRHGQGSLLGLNFGMETEPLEHPEAIRSWTTVTDDSAFIEHLLALYFCWEYPTFASLSKEHFLDDFRTGQSKYCSPLLVNSLLSVGCRFSNQTGARVNMEDPETAGDHFYAEAARLLNDTEDWHTLTTVQALGLMAIREASCGRTTESVFLTGQAISIAIEMGLHIQNEESAHDPDVAKEEAVKAATFWGAFSLDQAWSLSIGRLPRFSRDTKLVSKPGVVDHIERSAWMPYTDDGAPLERNCMQPSNVRSVFTTFCELSEIVHHHLYAFYSPGTSISSKKILAVYTRYLSWYEEIPSVLRLGQNFTPAVLFAHMYYHFAILLLFRPFIKLKFTDSSVSPLEVCNQAADAISALVNSYSRLYTLRRTPSFVPYFVLASSVTHLTTLGGDGVGIRPEKFTEALSDLKEMKACHGFATQGHNIVRFLAHHWDVPVDLSSTEDIGTPPDSGPASNHSSEDTIKIKSEHDNSTKPENLCRPSSMSANFFCPNFQPSEWTTDIKPVQSEDENPLFWPFPMQGKPMIGTGDMLAAAGFAVLGA